MKKVSDVLADFLADQEIRHVFGIVGSGNAHIFDSITKRGYTEIICVHHEQAAVMAMGTYFRISGKVSAALVTTGGGTSNAYTGVVSCWMDSIPGLIIAGNENSRFTQTDNPLRIWGIQGFDSIHMAKKVTKYANRITDPNSILAELGRAYDTASTGRMGPTWLEIPMNIQASPVEEKNLSLFQKKAPIGFIANSKFSNLATAVDAIADKLTRAKRPVLWIGHGIRAAGAVHLIPALAEKLNAPVLVSWTGIDMFDSYHRLNFGRAGIYGQRAANFVLQNCDFLLNIGNRMAIPQIGYELSELCRDAEIAVVDIDPREVEKHGSRISYPVCADAKIFMESLLPQASVPPNSYQGWLQQCEVYRKKYPVIGPEHADQGGFLNSYPFMQKLTSYFRKDEVVVTDMGTALLSGHQTLLLKQEQRLMTSTGLGEMGFGLPAAMGASFAHNKGEVICLNCDGGMMMNLQELQTINYHRLPIKIFVFNNDGYLMIKHTQKALFGGHYSGTDKKSGVTCPDFSKVAKAFDMKSFQIRTWQDFDAAMPEIFNTAEPMIIEVFMHPEQLFVPKLGLAPQKDGSIVSPPLEDLAPFLPREELKENMIVGIHEKSLKIKV